MNISTEDDAVSFKYVVGKSDKGIQIMISSDIKRTIVPSEFYTALKVFYEEIINKQNERVVLVKKT